MLAKKIWRFSASGEQSRKCLLIRAETRSTADHVVSTAEGRDDDSVPRYGRMLREMRASARRHGFTFFDLPDSRQGIVHVVAPEQGIALPGATLVCGDSHTCTVGGVGALSWGIGSSEVNHVMTTQTLVQKRPPTLRARLSLSLPPWQARSSKSRRWCRRA